MRRGPSVQVMNALLELTDVSKTYHVGDHAALDGVTLSIDSGEVVAIMGPSGSGKSTLLNVIAGLDRATAGTVSVDGVDIGRLSETGRARFRRQEVGMVFQFFNLLNNLTALDNVQVAAQLAGRRGHASWAAAMDLLERLGVADLADRYPARLSGGERQRVAIARALVNRPPLLLADEPTGALDTATGEQVLEIFSDLNRAGQTIVLVTHDPRLAGACASRTLRLVDGAVQRDITAPEQGSALAGAKAD